MDRATTHRLRGVIKGVENHYFSDVHTMLKLPHPRHRMPAGCNFAIAQVLAAAVSGISVTLYSHSGGTGVRFKRLLSHYYLWNREPASTVTPEQAAETIYSVFRNPLTHDLGLDLERKAHTPIVKIKRLATRNKTNGLPERSIEKLETTSDRIAMSATVTVRPDATVLLVEAFYWGVRCMVETLPRDSARMSAAEAFLARL
jgi:hypothetical protein